MSGKEVREAIGVVAVVAGLLFVGLEIRQNNQLARAAAYQSMGAGLADFWLEIGISGDPDLQWRTVMQTLTPGDLEAMSDDEKRRSWVLWVSSLRTLEATWRQVQLGLLKPEAFTFFGNDSPGITGPAAQNLRLFWPDVKALMSPDFAEFIESSWQVTD